MYESRGKRHSSRHVVRTIGAVVLTFFVLAGCFNSNANNESNADAQPQIKKVKVEKVSKQKIAEPLERTGEIFASAQSALRVKSAGTIQQVMKNRGEFVQEGEAILRMNSPELQAQKQKAALAVQDARDKVNQVREKAAKEIANSKIEMEFSIRKMTEKVEEISRNYNKTRNDYDVRLASRAKLDLAEKEWKNAVDELDQLKRRSTLITDSVSSSEAEKSLREAQSGLDQVEQAVAELTITAPISGILTGGQTLQSGAAVQPIDQIGVVQKLDPIIIRVNLPEAEAKLVRGKTQLSYYLPGTKDYKKVNIDYLADLIDPQARTYELILQFPNPDMNLKPGMKAQVQLTNAEELEVVALPTYSIIKDGEENYIFVLVDDTVEKRRVQLGRLGESYQEVLSGVKEGELVVISGQQQLVDKEKVQRPQ